MRKILTSLWAHLSFVHRIFIAISFSILCAGALMLVILTKQDAKDAVDDLAVQQALTLKTLPILIAEAIVIGDYENIQQQLNEYVTAPYIQHIVFYDQAGKFIQSSNTEVQKKAPVWFENLFGLFNSHGQTKVSIGGVDYGAIEVTLSIQRFSNRIWNDFRMHLGVLLVVILVDFLSIWLTLYGSLKQLRAVEQSTKYLSEGYFEPIQVQGGLRETTELIIAFNVMIQKVKAAQQTLKDTSHEMEQRKYWLESILNSMDEGVYAIDFESKILDVNAKACALLGYTEEEMLGQHAHKLFHSHASNGYMVPFEECSIHKAMMEKNTCVSDTEYFTCKDSRMIPVEIFGNIIMYEGKALGMVFAFRDIGEKKALEEKMKLLATALEATTNAVVITDKEAIIKWTNKGFEKMTGYEVGEALGRNPHELVGSGKQEKLFYEQMWQTLLSNQPWNGEIINKRKDNELYYEALHITPVSDDHGDITHFIAIKEDISKRKHLEEEMEHLAFYDPLTDLPNRRLLMDRIERAIVSAKRYQTFGAVFFLDLDYFKRINDELGHDVGDLLLQDMAKRLQNSLRQGDSIARLGGDEFVILLEDLGNTKIFATQYMKALAQKVQDAFIPPFVFNEKSYTLSISLGGVLFTWEQDANIILKNADSALYEAKQTGRHKSCFYNDANMHS